MSLDRTEALTTLPPKNPPPQGLLPNLIKLAPAAGISWYVFEETKRALGVSPGS